MEPAGESAREGRGGQGPDQVIGAVRTVEGSRRPSPQRTGPTRRHDTARRPPSDPSVHRTVPQLVQQAPDRTRPDRADGGGEPERRGRAPFVTPFPRPAGSGPPFHPTPRGHPGGSPSTGETTGGDGDRARPGCSIGVRAPGAGTSREWIAVRSPVVFHVKHGKVPTAGGGIAPRLRTAGASPGPRPAWGTGPRPAPPSSAPGSRTGGRVG